ncbi:TPA: phage tail protein [Campylobacter fetus subsp. venerealis]|uniref:Phage tail protein n=4 Tax=Campylobacter fetus TaxID=196 RepID=A0AAE6IXQ6_CAMFE|nr:phage tail protein [Campylobacter fetus]OCS25428.1 hypothetical protein CFVB10_08500 [Campylobacter fetus subsp. venerealis cfvB10]OCS29095.1 hypothetical protein CFVCCUG33900_08320 [Campylobacter fetus subsp. venerealis LMG 6570 = CCUG 33900]AIR80131.1 putative phage tail protein [Campylobacter fetus subsp. venerealis 97/608]EAK0836126.1 hypothetical protein [Campylobacter fetus]EGU23655.1 Hypothetical protein CFV354_0571 [Campylobacter fetus subsp. venerealis NCTC 10354]
MWFAAFLVVAFAAAFFLMPTAKMQDAKAAGFDDFTYPTNSNSRLIPEIFGTVECHGNIIYAGQLSSYAIEKKAGKGKSQTVGYAYYMGLAYALCTSWDELKAFKMNGDVMSSPNLKANGTFSARTGKNQESSNPKSTIYAYNGKQTTPDAALCRWCGKSMAYSGTAYFVFHGFIGENTTATPSYSVVLKRTNLLGWGSVEDINGDANPASMLYYLLSVLVGYESSSIDLASFQAVARQLKDEGLGMSLTMSNPNEANEWIEEILRTIDGVIIVKNGLLYLRLLRGGYDISSLIKVDSSNACKIKLTKKSWDELYTKITVKYTDRSTFKSASLSATNTAARLALGYDRAYDVEYMGITSGTNASNVMNRLFKKISYPVSTISFKISEVVFEQMLIGDVFFFSSSELGVNDIVFRITSLGSDRQDDGGITVEAIEDIFGLSNATLSLEQEDLSERLNLDIGEIEYFECRDAAAEQSVGRAVIPLIAKPSGFVQNISVSEGDIDDIANASSFLLATLVNSYNTTSDIDEDGFLVRAISPLYPMVATELRWQRVKFSGFIGDEQFAYGIIETTNEPNIFRIKRIMRGMNNTKKSYHSSGTRVWLCEDIGSEVGILPIVTTEPTIKAVAQNYINVTETKSLSYKYKFSVEKPYTPSNIQGFRDGGVVNLSWTPCVRLAGANFRNCDTIVAGEDEGKSEGAWEIRYSGGVVKTDKLNAQITTTATTFYIKSVLGGYFSDEINISIR